MQTGDASSLSSIASRNRISTSNEQLPLTFRNVNNMKRSEKDAPVNIQLESENDLQEDFYGKESGLRPFGLRPFPTSTVVAKRKVFWIFASLF